jgi:hypothetical protein
MKRSLTFIRLLLCIGAIIFSHSSFARVDSNPFENYILVADGIYVHDRSQFTQYVGPIISPRNDNPEDGIVERRGVGKVSVAPGAIFNVEHVIYPMDERYELKNIKTGNVFHEFSSWGETPVLYFAGEGVVYEYAPSGLCWGSATKKYEFAEGGLVETPQAMLLLNAETDILQDIKLYPSPNKTGKPVATLLKGTKATVLTYQTRETDHIPELLIKTPLGLTGWFIDDRLDYGASLSIQDCR